MRLKALMISVALVSISGCAGRAANPVMVYQPQDEQKTCQAIQSELQTIEYNIQRLIPESDKTGKNVALGVAGVFVWPAWLFMDLSSAEKEEINAFRSRHDRLAAIANNKHCNMPVVAQK